MLPEGMNASLHRAEFPVKIERAFEHEDALSIIKSASNTDPTTLANVFLERKRPSKNGDDQIQKHLAEKQLRTGLTRLPAGSFNRSTAAFPNPFEPAFFTPCSFNGKVNGNTASVPWSKSTSKFKFQHSIFPSPQLSSGQAFSETRNCLFSPSAFVETHVRNHTKRNELHDALVQSDMAQRKYTNMLKAISRSNNKNIVTSSNLLKLISSEEDNIVDLTTRQNIAKRYRCHAVGMLRKQWKKIAACGNASSSETDASTEKLIGDKLAIMMSTIDRHSKEVQDTVITQRARTVFKQRPEMTLCCVRLVMDKVESATLLSERILEENLVVFKGKAKEERVRACIFECSSRIYQTEAKIASQQRILEKLTKQAERARLYTQAPHVGILTVILKKSNEKDKVINELVRAISKCQEYESSLQKDISDVVTVFRGSPRAILPVPENSSDSNMIEEKDKVSPGVNMPVCRHSNGNGSDCWDIGRCGLVVAIENNRDVGKEPVRDELVDRTSILSLISVERNVTASDDEQEVSVDSKRTKGSSLGSADSFEIEIELDEDETQSDCSTEASGCGFEDEELDDFSEFSDQGDPPSEIYISCDQSRFSPRGNYSI